MKLEQLFHRHNLKKGILLVLLAWLAFSTMYMLSKVIADKTTVSTLVFFRSIVGVVFILPWVVMKWPKSVEVHNIKIVLFRGFMSLLNLLFILLAVREISLVNTTLLNNSAPFFVPLILWFWLRKPIDNKLWPAIILGFIGIAFILNPDRRIFNLGAAYGILSGICLALTLVTMRSASRKETVYHFIFYFFTMAALLSLPFAIANWKIEGFTTLLALIAFGALSLTGQILMYEGLKYAHVHQLAPFSYSLVIFSGIYEFLIFGQVPQPLAYFGIGLIIASGIWIAYISRVPKD